MKTGKYSHVLIRIYEIHRIRDEGEQHDNNQVITLKKRTIK